MMKTTALIFVSAILLLGAQAPSTESPAPAPARKALFCPECWRFLNETWDLDLQGRCLINGKKPVEVEGVTAAWLWCRHHAAWHQRPCGKGFPVRFETAALLVPAGSEPITSRAFCPQDRRFSDIGLPGMACPACAKPMVAAEAVERTWFWCATEKTWLTRSCPVQRTLHCCSPRSGIVLACPWQVPLLGEISLNEPSRSDMRVEAEWLAAHLDEPGLVVIHVGFDAARDGTSRRTEYLDGHIPGARPIAWGELTVTRRGIPDEMPAVEDLTQLVRSLGLDVDDRIVLYDTGAGEEAARAYLTLDYLGLARNAALLDGQWARWQALKLPTSRMPEEVEPSAFVPRLRPEIFVSFPEMKDIAWLAAQCGGGVSLLDARSADEYSGYRAGKGIVKPGHIAGARNLCWSLLLNMEETPSLLPEAELRGVFEAAGARPGQVVVTYCRTGVEASLVYFAAKYLGYETRFYDGSYYEWSREEEGPILGSWARR